MDPVKALPPEILDSIWSKLSFSDILSCLLVNHGWYESLSDCSDIWRKLCSSQQVINNSWKCTYLEEVKIRWAWKVGAFEQITVEVNDVCKLFCCSEEFVYALNDSALYKYSQGGKVLATLELSENVKQLCACDKIIVLLCQNRDSNKILILNEKLEILKQLNTNDNKINTACGKFWAWTSKDLVSVYWPEVEMSSTLNVAEGTTLKPLQSGWAALHGGEVHWLFGNSMKKKLYAVKVTPMACPILEMATNNKDMIAIVDKKIIEGRHDFSSVHIYRNGHQIHCEYLESYVQKMCFSGELLIICTKSIIHTFHIYNGILKKNVVRSVEIIDSVHDIFSHPKLSWILIEYDDNLLVYDANKNEYLIKLYGRTDDWTYSNRILVNRIDESRLMFKIANTNQP